MTSQREKVLVVCMLDSIHTARWLDLFEHQAIDFLLFPSTPNRKIHEKLKQLINRGDQNGAHYKIANPLAHLSILIWLFGLISRFLVPGYLVKRIVIKNSISKIHAIELNHAGYIVTKASELGLPKSVKIIATNWGSDIYWFQQFPGHLSKIKKLLQITDFYSAECLRDVELAHKYGFKGRVNEVLPNTGGFPLSVIMEPSTSPENRKAIVIKGYESFVGRASVALNAVSAVSALLEDFKIYVYSANRKTKKLAKRISKETNLDIQVFGKKSLTHNQVLQIFRQSRVYIGISLSDAISTSLLEAMVTGAYPIQTNTSCACEWIENGVSGSVVDANVDAVIHEIEKAIRNDELVKTAAILNKKTAIERLDLNVIKNKLENFYII